MPNHNFRETTLKVNACAVCGYDARVFRKGHTKVKPPIVLGHEICGEVQDDIFTGTSSSTSSNSSSSATTTATAMPITNNANLIESRVALERGTRVALCPLVPCLNCRYCFEGQYNLCPNLKEIGSSLNGGFAEYITIPEQTIRIGGIVPVPRSISNEEAALLEPLACCLNGFSKMRPFLNKRSVVIIGDGPIGLLHLQLSKMHGFNTAVVGKIEKRLRQAKALRADGVFMAGPHIQNDIAGFTDGYGADIIIIATSNPAALETAFQIAAKDSKINLFAGFAKGSTFTIDPNWLHYNQISITGSFSSTPSMLVQATNLAASRKINLSMIITHKFPLEEIEQAIEVTEKYRGLRAIINKF